MEKEKKHFKHQKIIKFCLIFIAFISCILLYSRYIGTTGIEINEHKIVINNLSKDFYGFKIVHITDIHYGRIINEKELNNLVNKINLIKPDIVVLTGDFIDKDTELNDENIKIISESFSKIEANIGKYAIKGNHDYKFKNWDLLIENCGFTNLNDTYETIYGNDSDYILISGVSTNVYGKLKITDKIKSTEDFINNNEIKPNYSILLMHEPDYINKIDYNKFNLILAGHSHNGQVRLPFIGAIYTPNGSKKYYDNYYKFKTTDLFISSGLGTSTINFRLFNRPSFNLYRLTNK